MYLLDIIIGCDRSKTDSVPVLKGQGFIGKVVTQTAKSGFDPPASV